MSRTEEIMRADAMARMDSNWDWDLRGERWLKIWGGFSTTWEWEVDLDEVRAGREVPMPKHEERTRLVEQAIKEAMGGDHV